MLRGMSDRLPFRFSRASSARAGMLSALLLPVATLADRFDASPAVAGRDLFLRGQANLNCLAAPPADGGKP
jgi:hypothetical protein